MLRTVVLDTNLLVLLAVGLTNPQYIEGHRRLSGYSIADFDLLTKILANYDELVVTPNICTEASNLLLGKYREDNSRLEKANRQIYIEFSQIVSRTSENYITSQTAANRKEFLFLGLADCVILEVANLNNFEILTVDANLHVSAGRAGYRSHNFNHLRKFD